MAKLRIVSLATEEVLWCLADFFGKIMFCSSLLHGNYITIEQRRLAAMRAIEEGNRLHVIAELRQLVEHKE